MGSIPLADYGGFIVDIDGVLVRGAEPIPGSIDALRALKAHGRVVLLTNNATKSRREIAARLQSDGFPVTPSTVVNSAFIVAQHLRHEMGPSSVFIVGELGLREELETAGHEIVDPDAADVVVTGMDRELTYAKLADALRALGRGARYVATNADATFPTPDGPTPGAGAIVGALRGMGYPSESIVGKPSRTAFVTAMGVLQIDDPKACLVVGDRLETDIDGAINLGCPTALVLSGVTERAPEKSDPVQPMYVARDLAELVEG